MEADPTYVGAYNTATNIWGWSEAAAKDLAKNAVELQNNNESLKGRPLKEFWDVNPTNLFNEHKNRVGNQVRTRFPPEPNGYAHTGHAKSMFMNFHESFERINPNLDAESRHVTFRYDDTNPEVESQEYIEKLAEAVAWLGWKPNRTTFTSNYFDEMYEFALKLIANGDAYVCHQTGDEIEASRSFAKARHLPEFDPTNPPPSPESPWRNATPEENRKKFLDMKHGIYSEGEASLRLKIDMYHPNPNLWDPVAYRIIYHAHPRTGDKWCIYPTYDFSHCIVDSLEDIDYSICTLEFETRRESYYWLLWKLDLYRPKVFEFARLDLTRTVMSKRHLKKLVETKSVRGWDDPRMPTLMGMKRRGFSKEAINKFMGEVGITRNHSLVEISRFFGVVQKELDELAPRAFGILDPVELELENIPTNFHVLLEAPLYPQDTKTTTGSDTRGDVRKLEFSKICYLDRENVREHNDNESFFGAAPGKFIRLKYGPLVEILTVKSNPLNSKIEKVTGRCWFNEGSPYAEVNATNPAPQLKPKGVLHWLSSKPNDSPLRCEIRLYDHLMLESTDENEAPQMNPKSEIVLKNSMIEKEFCRFMLEKAEEAKRNSMDEIQRFQLERVGFFCFDLDDCTLDHIVLNRILPLPVSREDPTTSTSGSIAESGRSRKQERLAQEAAKAERLKYSCKDFFKRPGEVEKYSEFDETGFPTKTADGQPVSKSGSKNLRKELDKHKKEREAAGFTD